MQLDRLIKQLQEESDWIQQSRLLDAIQKEMVLLGLEISTRKLAKMVGKSKTWVDVTLQLTRGVKVHPEIRYLPRVEAYKFLMTSRVNR